jgi:phosphatidylserine decarboxylase
MILRRQPIIIRQAFLPLTTIIILALIVNYQQGIVSAIGIWTVAALVAFFFRDPRRQIPPIPLAIVAPIDGRVIAVDTVHDPYLNRSAMRIQMAGALAGVYTVRSTMEGKVQKQWFGTLPEMSGRPEVSGKPESSRKSEQDVGGIYSATQIPVFAQWTQSDEGDDVVTTMSPKLTINLLASAIRCDTSSGERIGQGKRCSFVPFGSNAETLLPEKTRVDVKPGDIIKAGSSVIATLVRS